ncbi:MAG: S-layer homology domain-containing protein, partial [Pseudoflavonifractor sp.]
MKKMVLLLVLSALLITGASAAFTDVPAKAWYAQAVDRVAAKGMMSGTSESTFSPTAPVTRGTVVTVLWRLAGTPKMPSGNLFPDIPAGCWYAESANWARLLGIADGYSSGDFGGDDPVTREQLALFLYRYTKYIGGELAQGVLTGDRDSGKISPWAL